MSWGEQIFRYCERGQDAGFWAEPFNAASNAGFLLVAGLACARLRAMDREIDAADRALLAALVALAALIGIGSFLLHTFATRWARLADVVPIGLFMGAYLGLALRSFLGWSWPATIAALAGFAVVTGLAASIACPVGGVSLTQFAREPCLKGSMGYVPALATLGVVAALARRRPELTRYLGLAALLFLAAIVLRWLDRDLCAATLLLGRVRGTHAFWHLLNAATVHVLLQAAFAAIRPRATSDSD